jgi:hypothetical protein
VRLRINSDIMLRCVFLGASSLPIVACGVEWNDATQIEALDEHISEVSQSLIGTWTALTNAPPGYLDTCLLLTTGSVMCHQYNSNRWHRLTPDAFGSYKNGTWNTPSIPPMPNGNDSSFGCVNCTYAPLYFSSAVLPDGRAVVIGGEYISGTQAWSNIGFIYDPVANTWSSQIEETFGGGNVGDAQGIILQDGTYVLTNINTRNMEALNPTTGVFTARNPTGKLDINDEENWSILYDGSILTVNAWLVSSFERYAPSTNTWGNSGATPVNLADTGGLPVANSKEVGPCSLRPDNKLVCFSGNSLGQNAIYDPSANTWSHTASMDFPAAPGGGHFAMADGGAASLPNGNILVMASPVTNTSTFNAPSHFYEMSLSTNTLSAVTDSPHAASFTAYQGRMLVLPTGEVLLSAFNQLSVQDVMLYSNGGVPAASSRPSITSAPPTIVAGGVYTIAGRLFNGFSEGASYGDDAQSASNYPLVRITSTATGHVYYARTFNHSRMGVEPTGSSTIVTTHFEVPTNFENGPATLVVVANGIASLPMNVNPPLNVVNASSAINCVFSTSCTITVSDSIANIPLPGISGTARLQSRKFTGGSGSPAQGFYGYEYRVDLTDAVGILNIPCVQALRVDFGPVASFQYDGVGSTDQIYVRTSGIGSIGLSSANKVGDEITFTFSTPVCAGSSPGNGATSFFFGLASARAPTTVTAVVVPGSGADLSVAAQAPNLDKCTTGGAFSSASDSCDSSICAVDSYCCNVAWDGICVSEVRTVCGNLTCAEANGTCTHSLCMTGAPLLNNCDSTKANCVSSICAVDPYCCSTAWDNACIDEIESVCSKTCE